MAFKGKINEKNRKGRNAFRVSCLRIYSYT